MPIAALEETLNELAEKTERAADPFNEHVELILELRQMPTGKAQPSAGSVQMLEFPGDLRAAVKGPAAHVVDMAKAEPAMFVGERREAGDPEGRHSAGRRLSRPAAKRGSSASSRGLARSIATLASGKLSGGMPAASVGAAPVVRW